VRWAYASIDVARHIGISIRSKHQTTKTTVKSSSVAEARMKRRRRRPKDRRHNNTRVRGPGLWVASEPSFRQSESSSNTCESAAVRPPSVVSPSIATMPRAGARLLVKRTSAVKHQHRTMKSRLQIRPRVCRAVRANRRSSWSRFYRFPGRR